MNTLTTLSGRTILRLKAPRPAATVAEATMPHDEANDGDNTSVAGEEDPGAALEFTRPGRQRLPAKGRQTGTV
ncbi:hypothetical protein [Hydrogenophaga sp. RWCD_12]|uniref:hypothetical protein n=1 Tax=Hydrogenophaga sp. RWCD_12 TaxID=3391190 RepID=UPI003984C229